MGHCSDFSGYIWGRGERERERELNIYLLILYGQGIIPRNPEWEKKHSVRQRRRREHKSKEIHYQADYRTTKGTADCFVWWGIWEAIYCTSEQSIIGVEGKPFICWFFSLITLIVWPHGVLSPLNLCLMLLYGSGELWWQLPVRAFSVGGSEDSRGFGGWYERATLTGKQAGLSPPDVVHKLRSPHTSDNLYS